MDPIIFRIPGTNIALHWYGLIMALGIIVAGFVAEWGVRHRGEESEHVWDLLIWAAPAGIVGARLWYVVNETLGGSRYYLENPLQIINLPQGGLHFYGAVLFGAIAAWLYVRHYNLDWRLVFDAAAPALLVGQAVVRPANYINQELYGPPTDLPWGISIDTAHRIPPWNNLARFPLETTRFHPTFAYEILWNLLATGILLWAFLEFKKRIKPGSIFASWLVLEGLGRELIEFFRPDQPRIPGTAISYSRVAAGLMIVAGVIALLIQYEVIRLPFFGSGPDEYQLTSEAGSNRQAQK